jgi:hypothetical protein
LAEPEASSSGASATADAGAAADEQAWEADAADATGAEEPCHLQQQQQDFAADSEAGVGDQVHAAACLAQVQQQLDSRQALQEELSSYVAGLASRLGDDGEQLVTLPADYQLMVGAGGAVAAAWCCVSGWTSTAVTMIHAFCCLWTAFREDTAVYAAG